MKRLLTGFLVVLACAGGGIAAQGAGQANRAALDEAPRPFTDRGLANVAAFLRLLGYVRHFHPSDEAARTDWETFAVDGVRAIEGASGVDDLRQRLDRLFRPIAPSITISLASDRPRAPAAAPQASPGRRLVAWRHLGFGAETGGIPRSERLTVTAPAAPFDVDVGGGVSARIPLAVLADDGGTLPRGRSTPAGARGVARDARQRDSTNDRATRLAAVGLAWNILQHFYPYFDVVRTNWPAVLSPALQQAAIDRDESEFTDTLRRMIGAVRDGQSAVVSAAAGDAAFVPPVGLEWLEGRLVVTGAEASTGFVPGDAIITVEGVPAPLALEDRLPLVPGATPPSIRRRAAEEILAGPRGTQVRVGVERAASPGRRAEVLLSRTAPGYRPAPRLEALADLQPGILYVDLSRLSDADFAAAVPRLGAARGIVFDMRGASRLPAPQVLFQHLGDRPLTGPQRHVPDVGRPDRESLTFVRPPDDEWTVSPQAPHLTARKVFIADERVIGQAESSLMMVEYYRLGEIVGAPTAGTSGAVTRFQVPGGVTIAFTGIRVLRHDGSQHHGIGVRPTVPVARTRAALAAGRDELLERAVQVVSGG